MQQKNKDTRPCVLIARFSAIGDVTMTIPVVYDICAANPGIDFVFITKPRLVSIFVDRPANLYLQPVDTDGRYKGIRGMFRLARNLRASRHITAFADLHDVLRSKVLRTLLRLSGIRVATIDKGRRQKLRLIRRGAATSEPLIPQTARYARVFERLGLKTSPTFAGLWGGHAKAPVPTFPKPYVVIAPFAAHSGKIYPADSMERLISALDSRHIPMYIMGGGGREQRLADRWAAQHPSVTSLAGQGLGFARELEIINHAAVVVAMDSANMHLSAICATPTISIWGATHPAAGFAPWRQTDGIIQSDMPCRPCSVYGNRPCRFGPAPRCMEAIDPDVVLNKVLSFL